MVHSNSPGESDCLRAFADPTSGWIESTLVKADSQTSREVHEAGPTLARWGPRRAGLTPSKVDSQEVLNRGLRAQGTRQSEDPHISHVRLIPIQRAVPLVTQSTMPRPLSSASKVGRERVKEGPEEHRGILLTEDAKVTLDEVVQGRLWYNAILRLAKGYHSAAEQGTKVCRGGLVTQGLATRFEVGYAYQHQVQKARCPHVG